MTFATNFKPPRTTAAAREAGHRDRHGWRTAQKASRFGGPTQAGEKAGKHRHAVDVKRETRAFVWRRSDVCEYCGLTERETAAVCHKAKHEADEVLPRSLTRGLAPEVRFSTANTARACACCHRKKTEHQIGVNFHDEQLGMNGDVDIVDRAGAILRTVRLSLRVPETRR